MAKKVMVNVERVKPKTKIVMVKLEKVKQPKQPKDVSTHFKFKKVTEWANKQILARFKFKKVAKGENTQISLFIYLLFLVEGTIRNPRPPYSYLSCNIFFSVKWLFFP